MRLRSERTAHLIISAPSSRSFFPFFYAQATVIRIYIYLRLDLAYGSRFTHVENKKKNCTAA